MVRLLGTLWVAIVLASVAGCVELGAASPSSQTPMPPEASSTALATPEATASAWSGTPAAPPPTPTPTASPSRPVASAWPAVGKPPAADPTAGVYLSYSMWGDIGGAFEKLVVLDDGRVVVLEYDEPHGRLLTRRLTESGLAFVRSQVEEVGLFDQSQTRKVVHSPGCCGGGNGVTIVSGGKSVQVGEATLPGGSYAASAAWDRFEALVQHLAKPDAWIPSTDWLDAAWTRFHAANYCLLLTRAYDPEPTPLYATDLAWPAGIRPFATFGRPAVPGSSSDNRLGTITAAAAYRLAASIAGRAAEAGVSPDGHYVIPLSEGGWLLSPWIYDPDGGNLDDPFRDNPVQADLWPASPGLIPCPVGP